MVTGLNIFRDYFADDTDNCTKEPDKLRHPLRVRCWHL